MIDFRCWYCNRRYAVADGRAGEVLRCSCERRLRVPRRSGGNSRARTLADWLIEAAVYGGTGATLGATLAILVVSRMRFIDGPLALLLVVGGGLVGFLAGTFGGEAFINLIGQALRDRENQNRR